MRIGSGNLLTHHMVSVLLQPSLSPAYYHQPAGSRTSAFLLKTLSQACVMIGLGHDTFPGMKRLLASGRSRYSQIADTHVYPDHAGMRFGGRLCYFDLQGDEQIELLLGLLIPELGCPNVSAMLNESNMLLIARVG